MRCDRKIINGFLFISCMLTVNSTMAQVRKVSAPATTLTYQAAAAILNNSTTGNVKTVSSISSVSNAPALGAINQLSNENASFSIHDPIPNVVANHRDDILIFSLGLVQFKLNNNNYSNNDYNSDRNILSGYDNQSSYPLKVPEDVGLTIIKLKVLRPIENYALSINDSFMNDPTFSYLPGQGGQTVYLLWPQTGSLIFSLK